MNNNNNESVELQETALKFYKKHRDRVKQYQKENPDRVRVWTKKYYNKIRDSDPVKYEQYLQYHRMYAKQKREEKKRALLEAQTQPQPQPQ
jgi:hypothetical protein